jgi:hypothetical protein
VGSGALRAPSRAGLPISTMLSLMTNRWSREGAPGCR